MWMSVIQWAGSPESGTRQMTCLLSTVEHSNAGRDLPVQAQCERIVSVTCTTAHEAGRAIDLLVSHSRTIKVATFATPDSSGLKKWEMKSRNVNLYHPGQSGDLFSPPLLPILLCFTILVSWKSSDRIQYPRQIQ